MNVLKITEAAAAKLREKMAAQTPCPAAVLVSVKSAGCSGMSYDLKFLNSLADAPPYADQVVEHGVTVVVDPKATLFLVGSTVDYREDSMRSGFDFINPNEVARCGCGESFTVAASATEV